MAKFQRTDIDTFHDYGLYVPHRTIFMGSQDYSLDGDESGTDGKMAENIIKNLTILEAINQEPITIILNNLGGDVYHGLAIYDAIKACKSHVTIKVFGSAMSMGSIILQAADKRLMAPNAKQMIHYGSMGMSDVHTKTFQKWAKEIGKVDSWMEEMYLSKIKEKHQDFTVARLKGMLDHDTIMTAEESVNIGLADLILGEEEGGDE